MKLNSGKVEWRNISEIMPVLVYMVKSRHWEWYTTSHKYKYIDLRIDMRDGHAVIKNREGEPITLKELEDSLKASEKF